MDQTRQHVITIVSLLLFLLTAFIFMGERGLAIDERFINWVQGIAQGFLFKVMNVITYIGSSEVILLVTVIIGGIYLLRRNWFYLFLFATLSVGGVILNFGLKV